MKATLAKMKTIGIIGGMGPDATAQFYLEVIRLFQKKGAVRDNDFPEMYICNLPIPDVVAGIDNENKIKEMLCNAAKKLENCGSEFICIPCNSVQLFIKDIRNSVSIPVINIIEETALLLSRKSVKKAGILGTVTTFNNRLYEKYLEPFGIQCIIPEAGEQELLIKVIYSLSAGNKRYRDKKRVTSIAKRMNKKGAEYIVLGCTELSLLDLDGSEFRFIDTLKVLAQSAVSYSIGELKSVKRFNAGDKL